MQGFKLIIEIDKDEPEAAEVLVDGHADLVRYRFLLDTGSSKTILKYTEETEKYQSKGPHSFIGLFGKIDCDLIEVDRLSIGSIERVKFELARMSKNGPPRNQIGMDLLKEHCLHFIFEKNEVEVISGKDDLPKGKTVPLTMDKKNIPFVELELNLEPVNCFWDSGAGITCVDFRVIEANPSAFTNLGALGIEDTAENGNVDMPLYLMKGLSHAGHLFPQHRVVGADLSAINEKIEKRMDIVLGYNTLAKANWLFDFPNQTFSITKMLQ